MSSLTRKTPMPARRSPIARTGRLKAKRRPVSETERIYGPPEFRAWLWSLPCAVCGRFGVEQAHSRTGGTGRKGDAKETLPLCGPRWVRTRYRDEDGNVVRRLVEGCHAESHRGIKTFEAKHGVSLRALAAETWAAWQTLTGDKL